MLVLSRKKELQSMPEHRMGILNLRSQISNQAPTRTIDVGAPGLRTKVKAG